MPVSHCLKNTPVSYCLKHAAVSDCLKHTLAVSHRLKRTVNRLAASSTDTSFNASYTQTPVLGSSNTAISLNSSNTQPHIAMPQSHSHMFSASNTAIFQCLKHTATCLVPQTHSHNYLSVPQTHGRNCQCLKHSHICQCLKHTATFVSASNTRLHLSVPQTHIFQCQKHTATLFSASDTHLSVPETHSHIFRCLKRRSPASKVWRQSESHRLAWLLDSRWSDTVILGKAPLSSSS